jgi:deoxycytidine triphosphate deaminase
MAGLPSGDKTMLMSHDELVEIVSRGVITPVDISDINAASIDIHLGDTLLLEDEPEHYMGSIVDYRSRQPMTTFEHTMDSDGYVLEPGEFLLAHSAETFNLPDNISAEYKLKSSMARIGLDHALAGWCDAGWHGSVLTLELRNASRFHPIRIRPGDPIGQMIFFRHAPVPNDASYASRGRYNNDTQVSGIRK